MSLSKWPEIAAKAVRIKGKIDLNSLPPKYRSYLKRKRERARKYYQKTPTVRLDTKIYVNKWYPWCYKDYKPTLVLQGWFKPKEAKEKYYLTYGPHALDHIKFIQGGEAIARGFEIGQSLYINGQWRVVRNKVMAPRYQTTLSSQIRVYKNLGKHSSRRKEEIMNKRWKHYRYGQDYIPYTERKEGIKLSEIQKTIRARKAYVYEIPRDAKDQKVRPEISEYYQGNIREKYTMGPK